MSIPVIGISACLLGNKVRYNCRDKYDRYIAETVQEHVEALPLCPEFEAGMGTPREPVALYNHEGIVKIVGKKSCTDYTEVVSDACEKKLDDLLRKGVSGFLLKSKSPSCGMKAALHDLRGEVIDETEGIFPVLLTRMAPRFPVMNEKDIRDLWERYNFFARVFALARLNEVLKHSDKKSILEFIRQERFLLIAFSGEMVAEERGLEELISGKVKPKPEEIENLVKTAFSKDSVKEDHKKVVDGVIREVGLSAGSPAVKEVKRAERKFLSGSLEIFNLIKILREIINNEPAGNYKDQSYLDPFPAGLLHDFEYPVL